MATGPDDELDVEFMSISYGLERNQREIELVQHSYANNKG
jgi:hypothetical protein